MVPLIFLPSGFCKTGLLMLFASWSRLMYASPIHPLLMNLIFKPKRVILTSKKTIWPSAFHPSSLALFLSISVKDQMKTAKLGRKNMLSRRLLRQKNSFPDFCTFLLFRPRWTLGRWFAGPLTRSVVRLSPASFIWPQRAALTPSPIALSPNSPTPPWGLCANQGSTGDSNR